MTTNRRILKSVFPGKYFQGEGLIADIPELIKSFGKKGLIISSRTAKKIILSDNLKKFTGNDIYLEEFNGECCENEIKRLYDIVTGNNINVVAGVGGGKAIDTAKIVADRAGVPVIIVPTIASTDAPCSGCAVIYSDNGVFESVYYQKMNPQAVVVDMNVIAQAPVRFLIAGMGDALATWFEARSCERSQSMNECGGYSTMTGLNLAKLCYDTIISYGAAAKMACENKIITEALNRVVEANILLSGIGFESSGLATAHSIHNGLSALEETHSFYHGEKVAFGVLAGLHLTDALPSEIDTVYSFCEEIGLPTTFAEIGINNTDRSRLMKVALKAVVPQEGIHHEAVCITPEKVLYSMIAADAMGKNRKNCNGIGKILKSL
ncbi:MAG: glycerol dehydrogenase [Bacteroidales bacterium]|jgi:glycerol dehydrogenase